jgi:RNA polymerase sigma-70 factor, ECF subfamily
MDAIAAVHSARAAWSVNLDAFTAFVETREGVRIAQMEDLYLAFGAGQGSEPAIAELVRRVASLTVSHRRARVSAETLEDARQQMLERLLMRRGDQLPRITLYAGQGSLEGWLRISLAREALGLHERVARETPWEDILLPGGETAIAPDNAEAQYVKAFYTAQYRTAFERAAGLLTSRERALLRQHLLLGMNVDRLGEIYSVHRVTASRWVLAAKEALLTNMRKELKETIGLKEHDLKSIHRLLESRLEFSMQRVLQSRSA